jgi:hypothetical protein
MDLRHMHIHTVALVFVRLMTTFIVLLLFSHLTAYSDFLLALPLQETSHNFATLVDLYDDYNYRAIRSA